jgi:Zn-dependent protease with chaperone function
MNKNNYKLHENLIKLLICFIALIYFISLIIASSKVVIGIAVNVIHTLEAIEYGLPILKSIDISEVIIYLISLSFLLFFWSKIFKSFVRTFQTIRRTNNFIKTVPAYYTKKYNAYILRTKKMFAFTAGVWNSKVYISEEVIASLSRKELKAVLLHEHHHVHHHDPLWHLIIEFINHATPWIPFKKIIFKNVINLSELSADSFAQFKTNNNYSLLSALNKLLKLDHISNINLASFNLAIERIPILTGRTPVSYKSNYLVLMSLFSVLLYSGITINALNPVEKCADFKQCVSSLFTKEVDNKDSNLSCIAIESL